MNNPTIAPRCFSEIEDYQTESAEYVKELNKVKLKCSPLFPSLFKRMKNENLLLGRHQRSAMK